MAPITKTLALAGALFAISGAAAPVDKRAVVWETVTDVVWTTVDVTTTIYPNQGKPTATATVIPVTTTAAAVPTTTAAAVQEEDNKPAVQAIPTTSSSSEVVAPAPEPTTTEQAPVKAAVTPAVESSSSTSSAAPVETATARSESTNTGSSSSSSSSSGSSGSSGYSGACSEGSPCTGQMTYYDTATLATNPSSCGTTNDGETELVLALPVGIMKDSDCGKTVTIEYNGVTQTAKAVDKCMGCDDSSIDLSRALFEKFASFSAGRLSGAKWYIN